MTPDPTFNETRSPDYGTLQALAQRFWQWRAQHMPISYDDIPRLERPAGWVPDWTTPTIARRRQELAGFVTEWEGNEPAAWPIAQQVDYRLIGSALTRVRWEM